MKGLLRRGYAAIRIAGVLDVKRLLWVPAAELRCVELPDGYSLRIVTAQALADSLASGAYRPEIGSPQMLEDPRNSLFVAQHGEELAAYVWFATGRVEASQNYSRAAHLGTPLQLPPQTAFAYNAWTAPPHRGRRLLPALLCQAAQPDRCGAAGLVTTTDWTNAPALAAFSRVGFKQLGLIYRIGRPWCQWTLAPASAGEHGIWVGRR